MKRSTAIIDCFGARIYVTEYSTKDAKEDYALLIQDIPDQISHQLESDYTDTLNFCKEKNILCG
jgi:hypothetical protein